MNSIAGKMSQSICQSSPLSDYTLPTTKFVETEHAKKKISSEQSANLRRLLLVACLIDVETFRPLIKPLKGKHLLILIIVHFYSTFSLIHPHNAEYLDLEEIILYKTHTESSLRSMHGKIRRLQKAIVQSWNDVTGADGPNLKTMKWFALYKFVAEVKRSACASITNTGPLERTHKSWKGANGFTNRHPENVDKQTVNRLHIIQQSKDVVNQVSSPTQYNTASRRCIATSKLTTIKSNGIKCCLTELSTTVGKYAQYWKEMDRLEYCITQLYQVTLKMSKKFQVPGDTVIEIFPEGYMPYRKVQGSAVTSKKLIGIISEYRSIEQSQKRFEDGELNREEYEEHVERCKNTLGSFVTTAEHDGKDTNVWYAEIICFLKITPPREILHSKQSSELEVAFVKWYKEINKAERHELLGLPVLKVEKTQRKASTIEDRNQYQVEPFTDLRLTSKLLRPVFLQKDPGTTTNTFIHNTYVN